jgi:hypothetical protein
VQRMLAANSIEKRTDLGAVEISLDVLAEALERRGP